MTAGCHGLAAQRSGHAFSSSLKPRASGLSNHAHHSAPLRSGTCHPCLFSSETRRHGGDGWPGQERATRAMVRKGRSRCKRGQFRAATVRERNQAAVERELRGKLRVVRRSNPSTKRKRVHVQKAPRSCHDGASPRRMKMRAIQVGCLPLNASMCAPCVAASCRLRRPRLASNRGYPTHRASGLSNHAHHSAPLRSGTCHPCLFS